jgi:hypothetical protein
MCRADEQRMSVFGANAKEIVTLEAAEPAPTTKTAPPDTPNERLTTVLRTRAPAAAARDDVRLS